MSELTNVFSGILVATQSNIEPKEVNKAEKFKLLISLRGVMKNWKLRNHKIPSAPDTKLSIKKMSNINLQVKRKNQELSMVLMAALMKTQRKGVDTGPNLKAATTKKTTLIAKGVNRLAGINESLIRDNKNINIGDRQMGIKIGKRVIQGRLQSRD